MRTVETAGKKKGRILFGQPIEIGNRFAADLIIGIFRIGHIGRLDGRPVFPAALFFGRMIFRLHPGDTAFLRSPWWLAPAPQVVVLVVIYFTITERGVSMLFEERGQRDYIRRVVIDAGQIVPESIGRGPQTGH